VKLKAYILACDASWIEDSVLSYYGAVDEIVVSYDKSGRGWSGVPIPVEECLSRLKAIDGDNKMRFIPGDFARLDHNPLENDTYQRSVALAEAGKDADWVLELDTDEILPHPARLIDLLEYSGERDIAIVEWPMRIFFRHLSYGRFLEVCAGDRTDCFEYPGPVACRPGAVLTNARRAKGPYVRPCVKNDRNSLQVNRPAEPHEHRVDFCESSDAILHFSWARTPGQIRTKIASWGHNDGLKTWFYYYAVWKPSPISWHFLRDFHPGARGLWPALKQAANIVLPHSSL
jgi:hypothetical protein